MGIQISARLAKSIKAEISRLDKKRIGFIAKTNEIAKELANIDAKIAELQSQIPPEPAAPVEPSVDVKGVEYV